MRKEDRVCSGMRESEVERNREEVVGLGEGKIDFCLLKVILKAKFLGFCNFLRNFNFLFLSLILSFDLEMNDLILVY